jgi:hypothetical protein
MLAHRSLLPAVLPLLACGEPPEPTRFVAAVADDDGGVSIGLTVQDGAVAAYACGDDPEVEPYPGWFTGEAAGSSFALERDGWIFTASWRDDRAVGRLRGPWGEDLVWSAPRAGGLSGTYAARDAGCTTGVVVVDGPDPIVRGAWCNRAGEQRQVTPLGPMELIDGHLRMMVELDSGARTLEVAPVEPTLLDAR